LTPPKAQASEVRVRSSVNGELGALHRRRGQPHRRRGGGAAAARLQRYANGIPRALNNAATALLAAADHHQAIVDDTHAKKAIAELTRT